MIALLVRTTVIRIIIIVVMKKSRLAANRARRIFARIHLFWRIRSKLMFTNRALIFLIAKSVFAIFIKFFGVASWATIWYNFIHEILISFL